MGRIGRTWELAKASWSVLKADKELLALPVLSGLTSLIIAASFLIPIFAAKGIDAETEFGALDFVVLAVMYFVLAYVTIFFNAALVHAANDRLNGGDPTLRSALGGAAHRAGRILPWALITATVSIILRSLEERAGLLGRIVLGFIGLAWTLVTFLVVPILVIEDIGAIDAIKRSGSLFKRTWGENVAAQFGFGILGFIAALPAIALIFLGAAAGGVALGALIVVAVIWLIAVAVGLSALSGVFQAALYHYAISGDVPGQYFSPSTFNDAFAPRQQRRGIV